MSELLVLSKAKIKYLIQVIKNIYIQKNLKGETVESDPKTNNLNLGVS